MAARIADKRSDAALPVVALLFRRVGDSLLATPALRAIRKSGMCAKLAVIVEAPIVRVFWGNPWIDEVIVVPPAPSVVCLARAIRRMGLPLITVDFLSDPRSAAACLFSGARVRIGFGYRYRRIGYTHRVPAQDEARPIYSADHKLKLAAALGCETDGVNLDFFLSEEDRSFAATEWARRGWTTSTRVCALVVHSRRHYKRWPIENFAKTARWLRDGGREPLVLATPGDESPIARLRESAQLAPEAFLGTDDLGRLGAVLEQCTLLIGNDGGPKHLAVAVNTPTLTIFGRESPDYWTPFNSSHHVAIVPEMTAGGKEISIARVSVDQVYRAAEMLLSAIDGQ